MQCWMLGLVALQGGQRYADWPAAIASLYHATGSRLGRQRFNVAIYCTIAQFEVWADGMNGDATLIRSARYT